MRPINTNRSKPIDTGPNPFSVQRLGWGRRERNRGVSGTYGPPYICRIPQNFDDQSDQIKMSAFDNVVVGKLKLKGKALDVKGGAISKKKKKKHSAFYHQLSEVSTGWFLSFHLFYFNLLLL